MLNLIWGVAYRLAGAGFSSPAELKDAQISQMEHIVRNALRLQELPPTPSAADPEGCTEPQRLHAAHAGDQR